MPFANGENIGPYRIIEQLGQGGMATVYKAYHAALDRYVALKVLHPAFGEDKTFEARFQREARVVAKLEHPNIVPIYDYAEHEHRPYLVMKYIEGDTLKARFNEGPLNANEITQVVDSVGSALAYAHKMGILHRDIKPSNVLISSVDGTMYLADFGLARIAQAGESTLSSDSIMGTPQYISPEQARGDKDLNEGTDIYSFGVMLYEMVVGQVPFSADTPFSVIHDHIYTPLPLPRSINPNVPESVERVLLKALAKDRSGRYADVPSMVAAFKDAWASAGVPMQGTALTLPRTTKKVEPKIRKEEKKVPAVKTVVAEEQKASIVQAPATPTPRKRRSPWPYIAGSVLLVICCGFGFLALRNNRFGLAVRESLSQTPPAQVASLPTAEPPGPPTRQPEPQNTLPPLPPEVQAAQRLADENPQDAGAQLGLSLAFWDAGLQRQAYETLQRAGDLAGQDQGFFIEAGSQFTMRQAWIASAAMYLRAVKLMGRGADVPDDVLNNFHEAVYKAAPLPEFETTYPLLDEISSVDQPMGLVAQARHAYYNGRLDDGRTFLNQVKRLKPDFPEAFLLEGEFATIENRPEEAKLILTPLTANLDVPEWIRIEAEGQLQKLP